MINTNKKIHIYNRLRTIYTSKNRYYIRNNKKYIDIYTIIKKANRQRGGGAKKNQEGFLSEELIEIKNSIAIFKLLSDDKQSEAINIYINLIDLINSKREYIIEQISELFTKKYDTMKQTDKKEKVKKYIKEILFQNIFNNYLIKIIASIDINQYIRDDGYGEKDRTSKDNDIIKKLIEKLNSAYEEDAILKITTKIKNIKDDIDELIVSNKSNDDALECMVSKCIDAAIKKIKEAQDEAEKEEQEAEAGYGVLVGGSGDGDVSETGAEAVDGAGAGAVYGSEPEPVAVDGAGAGDGDGAVDKPISLKSITNTVPGPVPVPVPVPGPVAKTGADNEIYKVINEDMEVILEELNNLENKDYVKNLLPVLTNEINFYSKYLIDDKYKSSVKMYFNNIKQFLTQYNALYETYKSYITKYQTTKKKDLEHIAYSITAKEDLIEKSKTKLKNIKSNLKSCEEELEGYEDALKQKKSENDANGLNELTEEQLKENIEDKKNEIKTIKEQYANLIKDIRKETVELSDLNKKCGKITKKIEDIDKKIIQYKQFITDIDDLINKIEERLDDNNINTEKAKAKAKEEAKAKAEAEAKEEAEKAEKAEAAATQRKQRRRPRRGTQRTAFIAEIIIPKAKAAKTEAEAAKAAEEMQKQLQENSKLIEEIRFELTILYLKSKILLYFIFNYIKFCNNLTERKNEQIAKCNELNNQIKGLYKIDDVDAAPAVPAGQDSVSVIPTDTPQGTDTGPPGAPGTPGTSGAAKGGANTRVFARVCAYLTDVEGNLDFFEKYVRISKVIEWVDSKKNRLRFKQKDSMFVFGGDCQDRGIGDIRFVNLLLNFKSEYPDRVEFIIGNRDANKIRISSELSEKIYATGVADRKAESKYLTKYDNFPYWVNKDERITLRKYLNDNNFKIDAVSRLKYILDYTMGSNDSFDKRRKELSIILNKSPDLISDNDIVTSFLNSVSPNPKNIKNTNDNYLLKYLKSGKIAYIFGEHIFVHGAINKNNIGYIPNNKNIVDDVDKWVSGLNKWFQKDLKEYMANPEYGGISKRRKGYKIIDYAVPSDNKTVVYSDNLKNGNGQYINAKVIKYLNKGGIHSIISGHRPHGDCPLVLRSKKLTAVSADTSYSKKGHRSKWGIDNRGNAVSEVLLYLNGDIQIHGILRDNQKYDYIIKNKDIKPVVPIKPDKSAPKYDKYIGLQLKNNYWVKNVKYDKKPNNSANAKYLISYAKGFEYDDKWITEADMLKLL